MKTPIQELEKFIGHQIMETRNTEVQLALSGISAVIRTVYLEKEKKAIIDARNDGMINNLTNSESYYNETYKQ